MIFACFLITYGFPVTCLLVGLFVSFLLVDLPVSFLVEGLLVLRSCSLVCLFCLCLSRSCMWFCLVYVLARGFVCSLLACGFDCYDLA